MASVRAALDRALGAWWQDHTREELALWRGDPDASPPRVRARRHAQMGAPVVHDAFLEACQRQALPDDEKSALAGWLYQAITEPARIAARDERERWMAEAVPHDSDWHSLDTLLDRIRREPRARERRALASSVTPAFEAGLRVFRRRGERLAELRDGAKWLEPFLAAPPELAEVSLSASDDAWHELSERLAHAAGTPFESWEDLLFVLRATRFDDAAPSRNRWRRVAESLGEMRPPLAQHARAEPGRTFGHGMLVLRAGTDVRVNAGRERGVFSERECTLAMGRAFAAVTTHPAVPEAIARPRVGAVGWQLGALLAHRMAEPAFLAANLGLDERPRRAVAELALGIELAEVRVHAAWLSVRGHRAERDFAERARAAMVDALKVDVPQPVAALALHTHRPERGEALALAPRLYVGLRERFDEDWWRNPQAEELLRSATARGDAGTVATLIEAVPPLADDNASRLAELLR